MPPPKMKRKGGEVGGKMTLYKNFFFPFFSFLLFPFLSSFFFFFYSSLSKVDGWLVKENDKAAPAKEGTGGGLGHLGKMLNILYIFPYATKNR